MDSSDPSIWSNNAIENLTIMDIEAGPRCVCELARDGVYFGRKALSVWDFFVLKMVG